MQCYAIARPQKAVEHFLLLGLVVDDVNALAVLLGVAETEIETECNDAAVSLR